ncbi:MAG: hypothetical protein ABEK29_11360, partial [Bradymonadaceae bacterium]
MTFGRAIIISMIAHLGVLGYGYMQPPPADTVDLEFAFESEDRTVEVRRLNLRAAFHNDGESQSPHDGIDVTAGLTPEGDEPAAVQSE